MTPAVTGTKSEVLGASVAPGRRPRHVAIIMDGNGRWAQARGLARIAGHAAGANKVSVISSACSDLGLQALTLYSFSSENWKRPPEEVAALMELCREHLLAERQMMLDKNIRFRRIGRRDGVPDQVLETLDESEQVTASCTGMTLALALNYGSRTEILDAVRRIAQQARDRTLDPASIDEQTISDHLYTAGLPDPDLLIRTAGEMRISNYLLWQISYAELHVTDVLWPDFTEADLHTAFRDYASRKRTYGGLQDPV